MTRPVASPGMLLALLLVSLLFHDAATEWVQTAELGDAQGVELGVGAIDRGVVAVRVSRRGGTGSVRLFEREDDDGAWSARQELMASDAQQGRVGSIAMQNGTIAFRNGGGVYLYDRGADGLWSEQQKLVPSDLTELDGFGTDLAFLDGNPLVLGVLASAETSFSVFVYTRQTGDWTQSARLMASSHVRDGFDFFRGDMEMSGDTIVVGAQNDDTLGDQAGAAFVFQLGQDGTWTEQQKLTPSDGEEYDGFGVAVAIEGDELFVSSYDTNQDNNAELGAVYAFSREEGSWTEQAKLISSDIQQYDWFGRYLAFSDGLLVVGADGDGSTGSVYLFGMEAEMWSEQAKLIASVDPMFDWYFGTGVDVDNGVFIAGSYSDIADQGFVYVFEWRGSENPSILPSRGPSMLPTVQPTRNPSAQPSFSTSVTPSIGPSMAPTSFPSDVPSDTPSDMPSETPSFITSQGPSIQPSSVPTVTSSDTPSVLSSTFPSAEPTSIPTSFPTQSPGVNTSSVFPSAEPSLLTSDARPTATLGFGATFFCIIVFLF